ncbi:MAG: TonB-dependent receptor [Sphingobacteriales bacterium]|nr:MAG: TonB-dependent receptor [Sphingobacteriales bacterium]
MKIINFIRVMVFLLLPLYAHAQTVNSNFFVKDKNKGVPIPGVYVYVPELQIGTITNIDGWFTFDNLLHKGNIIQLSKPGYETGFFTVTESAQSTNIYLAPSALELQEVKIIGTQIHSPKSTSHAVTTLTQVEMRENGALSVSDAISRLPGVSQLTTGAGISKPVIRGLYGNRVQVNVMGLRFDNQQWQDEHGLGLSDMGISRVEIIKGPAALMYGSDAMGGVLNVVEERPAPVDSLTRDITFKAFSNTFGLGGEYGVKKSTVNKWWRFRIGVDNHADYSSSGNQRVLNSRFASYNTKASVGFTLKNWVNVNSAYLSFSQFGFVFDSLDRKVRDNRLSRTFDGPHHRVLFGVLSSENTFYQPHTKWKVNAGIITNLRQEQEGGNRISLNMLLNTGSLLVQATKSVLKNGEWTNGVSGYYQTNVNYGARTIVPDANTAEASAYSYLKQPFGKFILDAGFRLDLRNIHTFQTSNINAPGKEIQPFNKTRNAANTSFGLVYNPWENLNLKGNFSTGYRSGNLAELSSNGLHEGTLRWEIGDPNLKTEQNFNSEAGFTYELGEQIELNATVFKNHFRNYIYLAPTGTEYVGFDIYRFRQTDATLKGGEVGIDIHPKTVKWLDANVNYSYLDAKKADDSPLPFIPANKLQSELRFKLGNAKKWQNTFFKTTGRYIFAQNKPDEFETSTPGYFLLDAALGTDFQRRNNPIHVSLVCTNLLDKKYVDHLSRFKYYGLYNMGRNINLNINFNF